jgi:hypothetical protein
MAQSFGDYSSALQLLSWLRMLAIDQSGLIYNASNDEI